MSSKASLRENWSTMTVILGTCVKSSKIACIIPVKTHSLAMVQALSVKLLRTIEDYCLRG